MKDKYSFKSDGVHGDIDKELKKVKDKIQLANEVREHPPEPEYMNTPIPDDMYAIDLNALYNAQLSDCPSTVIPMLIDHGIRTAVDIRDTYKPEKRHLDFQYWWVIFLVIGFIGVLWFGNMMFGIF